MDEEQTHGLVTGWLDDFDRKTLDAKLDKPAYRASLEALRSIFQSEVTVRIEGAEF